MNPHYTTENKTCPCREYHTGSEKLLIYISDLLQILKQMFQDLNQVEITCLLYSKTKWVKEKTSEGE